MRPAIIGLWLVVTGLALADRSVAADEEQLYKVIVHPENPIQRVDEDFLRNAFLKKATDWGTGATVRPIDLKAAVRERFTRDVLKKTPEQLRAYWNQQVFSGKGVPPPAADSPRAVIAYVLANPGSVGYIPVSVDPGGAKVVPIK